ncbi:MAG: nucleotidyltransferase family protein [Ruminococcus sp.]|jgi:predicted nucleotidyltransferase|nr:nucleotidyltransferase family protein [Ruminococcus sp.]
MKISGIICEYNPFHNGHLHHISETKKNGATHIAAVMSGNFVQRGDVALIDKIDRAKLAVKSGADLVIEIPVPYCLSSAELYAKGAVSILGALGAVDELSFGSECGNIDMLLEAMDSVERCAVSESDDILSLMEMGYTYPKALSSIVMRHNAESAEIISQPNNLLAIEYMRAMKLYAPRMKYFTIKRKSASHDSLFIKDEFASASYIRDSVLTGTHDISQLTTPLWADALQHAVSNGEVGDINRIERIILYMLRMTTPEILAEINDVGQGLENRIYSARMSGSLEELLFTIKTKRYTMARIRRILLSALIGVKKSDVNILPPYCRILAINERGRDILAKAKMVSTIPFDTSLVRLSKTSSDAERFAQLEIRASDIYGLSLKKINSAQKDFRSKIMIDMD